MEPAEPEELLEAFRVLDPENHGTLTKDYFAKLMMEEGEPFTQEEVDEMMAVAVDPLTGLIPYEYFLNQLMVHTFIFCLIVVGELKQKPQHKHFCNRGSELYYKVVAYGGGF